MCIFCSIGGGIDYTLYDCQWNTGYLSGGNQGDFIFHDLETNSTGAVLWYFVCYSDLYCRNNICDSNRGADWSFDGCFLAEIAPKKLAAIVKPAVELLAGIPSVIYGLLGLMILNPLMYRWEQKLFRGSETHQFTGGANLISAVLVLAIMILPTVINISESAIKAVSPQLKASSLALGASHIQTIFQVMLPAAKSGIITAIVLGVGRAIGEAMAISLVSGSSVNFPLPFNSVRFLTTAIVSEMGYASGLHRQVLFTIGLVLFCFIMLINITLNGILKKGELDND